MPISLGVFRPASSELGDGDPGSGAPGQNSFGQQGLEVRYNILPQGTKTLAVTYSIEQVGQKGLPIFYLVGSEIAAFAINGNSDIPAPETMTYIPPAQIGLDLSLGPVIQGYASVSWTWSSLSYPEAAKLLSCYNPQNPQVLITYPNSLGFWVSRVAMFQPPQIGARGGGQTYSGLTLTFTHLIPD